ncbi:MAG: VOC family protein [Beijerinckiaceae bacterium]
MPGAHTFVWYELMTTDERAAEAFYRHVVGWSAADAGIPSQSYILMSAGDHRVAGIMPLPTDAAAAGGKPGWIGYIVVGDVGASAARVKQKGGAVHRPPADIPGVGRFAIVADPQGVTFALFKGEGTPAPAVPQGTPGHGGWHELRALDGVKAFAFYADMFGWTKAEAIDMGPLGTYQIFAIDGVPSGGMMTKGQDIPAPQWLFYFTVPDIDAAAARVKEKSGEITQGPHEVPGGSFIVHGRDPQGALFALVALPK